MQVAGNALTDSLELAKAFFTGPALLLTAVRSALARSGPPLRFASLLDIGCGTGLAGAVFVRLPRGLSASICRRP